MLFFLPLFCKYHCWIKVQNPSLKSITSKKTNHKQFFRSNPEFCQRKCFLFRLTIKYLEYNDYFFINVAIDFNEKTGHNFFEMFLHDGCLNLKDIITQQGIKPPLRIIQFSTLPGQRYTMCTKRTTLQGNATFKPGTGCKSLSDGFVEPLHRLGSADPVTYREPRAECTIAQHTHKPP